MTHIIHTTRAALASIALVVAASPTALAQTAPEALAPPPPAAAPVSGAPAYVPAQVPQPASGYGHGYAQPGYALPAPAVHVPTETYHVEQTRSRKSLWLPGIILFAVGWIGDFGIVTPIANMISNDRPDSVEEDAWAWSVVPIVGPLVQLAIGAPHPALALTMGIFQLGGLAMTVVGLATKETVQVPMRGLRVGSTITMDAGVRPVAGGAVLELSLAHL